MAGSGIMRDGASFEFEIPYIDAVHFDQLPGVMAREALLVGHRYPPLDKPFTYCDMGCGTGATLITLAASYPEAKFYGVDLSADHIAHAQAAAEAASLTNITFFCGTFADAAAGSVPPCDYISAHGILSWIPQSVEAELLSAVATLLNPGGLFQLSANLQPGWGQMSPLRAIMRHYVSHASGNAEDRLREAIHKTRALVASDDHDFGKDNPEARGLTGNWRNREAAYVGHEMLGGAWRHFTVGEVMALCRHHGLHCCGPIHSERHRNRATVAAFDVASEETEVLEDFWSLAKGEGFRSLTFIKPEAEDFERSEMQLEGEDVIGFPVFARWSVWAPPPEVELSDWTVALDSQPHYLGRVLAGAMTGEIPEEEFAAVAKFVGAALMVRNAIIYANAAFEVDTENCSEMNFEAVHPLTTQMLAKPRTYRYGGHAPSTVLGGGLFLRPAQAALLRAYLEDAPNKIEFARSLLAELDPEAPPWALEDPDRTLPDPADDIVGFRNDWLPFLLRLGVIRPREGG